MLQWEKKDNIYFKAYVCKNRTKDCLYSNSYDGIYLHLVVVQVFLEQEQVLSPLGQVSWAPQAL